MSQPENTSCPSPVSAATQLEEVDSMRFLAAHQSTEAATERVANCRTQLEMAQSKLQQAREHQEKVRADIAERYAIGQGDQFAVPSGIITRAPAPKEPRKQRRARAAQQRKAKKTAKKTAKKANGIKPRVPPPPA